MKELNKLQNKLNEIIDDLIDGAKEDLVEAEHNISVLYEMIEGDDDQRMLYGSMYHDALKIKGQVRTRNMQIATLLKDRISKIESDELKKSKEKELEGQDEIIIDHRSIGETFKTSKKSGELKMQMIESVNHDVEKNLDTEIMEYNPSEKKVENG